MVEWCAFAHRMLGQHTSHFARPPDTLAIGECAILREWLTNRQEGSVCHSGSRLRAEEERKIVGGFRAIRDTKENVVI